MKGLNIDRDKIGKVINENYASKFDISLEEKPSSNLWVYKFKGTGIQPAMLNVYYVNDGTGITVNQSAVTSCGLLLDPDEPFYPEPINRRTSTGR